MYHLETCNRFNIYTHSTLKQLYFIHIFFGMKKSRLKLMLCDRQYLQNNDCESVVHGNQCNTLYADCINVLITASGG